jgi:hypothetical protein
MTDTRPMETRKLRIGFRTSIVTLFVAGVLLVGLTLVYLSFNRVSRITQTAASTFIDKVAQLGADRIDAKFRNVRDSLEILAGLPSIQSAEIEDNSRLYGLMASMLRNNPQIFNLYVGYEDGSFLEMDVIDRAKPGFRTSLNVDEDAAFRLVVISRTGASAPSPVTLYLSENLIQVAETKGPASYDPRQRPWYIEAFKDEKTLLTGPYVLTARLHLAHDAEGGTARRCGGRSSAQSPGANAGRAEAWQFGARLPVHRVRPDRRSSRDGPLDRRDPRTRGRVAQRQRRQAVWSRIGDRYMEKGARFAAILFR